LPADNETYKYPLPEWAEQKRLRRFAPSGKFHAFAMPQATLRSPAGMKILSLRDIFTPDSH
jgi:hypothetical protein